MNEFTNMRSIIEALKENLGRKFMRERTRNGKTYHVWQASYEEVCEFLDEHSDYIVNGLQEALGEVIEKHKENGVVELIPPEVAEREINSLINSVKKNSLSQEGIKLYEDSIKTHRIIIGVLVATIIVMFLLAI